MHNSLFAQKQCDQLGSVVSSVVSSVNAVNIANSINIVSSLQHSDTMYQLEVLLICLYVKKTFSYVLTSYHLGAFVHI